jgi:pre-rRNA-processing protein IPI3
MQLQETIFCATAPGSSASGPGTISIHDIQTGASYASFKPSNSGINSTTFIESKNGEGGFILAAQSDKSVMHVFNFQKVRMI